MAAGFKYFFIFLLCGAFITAGCGKSEVPSNPASPPEKNITAAPADNRNDTQEAPGQNAPDNRVQILETRYLVNEGKVSIPRIIGISDPQLQSKINKTLKDRILALNNNPHSSLNGTFTIHYYNGRLLVTHFIGDSYTPGSAHPNKIDIGLHMDLATGDIYSINDLFKKGVDFGGRIEELCQKNDEAYRLQKTGYWNDFTAEDFAARWTGEDDSFFILSGQSMRVYYYSSYALGYVAGYNIPYSDLLDIIDTEGALWKALTSGSELKAGEPILDNEEPYVIEGRPA